uniref:Fibulin-7-like n=1 Tax=Oncorhynchus tshawytscha TaxID=74940 RepID=A0A8C8FMV0_ONCTS
MHAVIVFLCLCPIRAAFVQDCPSRQDMQSSLKQVQKLLSTHEAAYLQSLRTLRKKLNLLQNTATKQTGKANNDTCLKLDTQEVANSRKLGKAQNPGHEVHFLCDAGYELVGAESRMCQESLTWSDINECASSPCLNGGTCVDEMNQFSCTCTKAFVTMTNTSSATSSAATTISPPAVTVGPFFHPSHCTHVQGTTHCTCDPGYTISGRDGTSCKDIDECELFHMGQAGRLCIHACVNTPGGYRCTCPAGYNLTRDGRNCKDIDECATRLNNCTRDQMCLNNYGGFQCVRVDCPAYETPPTRNPPCSVDNKVCSQAPNSISHHYLSVVSNLSAPRTMFRVSTLRLMGNTLRFSLLGRGQAERHFTVQRSDRQTGQLVLGCPVQGPATLEAEVEMTELEKGVQLERYITKITMFISQYEF